MNLKEKQAEEAKLLATMGKELPRLEELLWSVTANGPRGPHLSLLSPELQGLGSPRADREYCRGTARLGS